MKNYAMKRQSWGRRPDSRRLVAAEKHSRLITYSAVYGGSAAAFMMTMAALATLR